MFVSLKALRAIFLVKIYNLVKFSNPCISDQIFSSFNTKHEPKEKNHVCAITGEKAKYFDPLTLQYYSSVDAFKKLREKYFQKEEDNLLFRIQALSDLASQKKEKLKKLMLMPQSSKNSLNMIHKIGLIKSETIDFEKKTNSIIILIFR